MKNVVRVEIGGEVVWGESMFPEPAVEVIWQSCQWVDDFTSCLRASVTHRAIELYLVRPPSVQGFCNLSKNSSFYIREMDLYFPDHWPGYYYKWEGNNISWTAGNLLHICPFRGGLWAGDSVHPLSPLQAANMLIHPFVCLSGFLNLISLLSQSFLWDSYIPRDMLFDKCLRLTSLVYRKEITTDSRMKNKNVWKGQVRYTCLEFTAISDQSLHIYRGK